jgi:hypothetical protein
VLDLPFVVKADDGSFEGFNIEERSDASPELVVFEGAARVGVKVCQGCTTCLRSRT